MKKTATEQSFWAGIVTVLLISIVLGVLLIALPVDFLLKVIFVIMGIVTVLSAISGVSFGLTYFDRREGKLSLISSGISLIVGILMIFWHNSLLMILLGVYLLVLPIVEILLATDRAKQLKTELPKMVVGVVLLLVGPAKTVGMLFDIAGWLVLLAGVLWSAVSAVLRLTRQSKYQHTTGNRVFVDHNGDGNVDSVIVDTTGDGKPDTEKTYRNHK